MEVKLAECAGFCFGVKRAVDTVYEKLNTGKTIYTYGPIVHNEEVVGELERLGVKVLQSKDDLLAFSPERAKESLIVIRAHGVPKEIIDILEEKNLEYVDCTCPFVKRIHKIVEEESMGGKPVYIAGNPGHPEVEGIKGWCHGEVIVIQNVEEAQNMLFHDKNQGVLVAQTTFNYNNFDKFLDIFKKKGYNGTCVNTICNATEERQRAARKLAAEADVMIVIGGKHSSNTKKLYEICSLECANTYFIQTLEDLHLEMPNTVRLVGITAGASTPNKLIEEVQNYVRINF